MGENYIVAKGAAGFGNRILAAATALLYAQISGRRLIVDWTDGSYSPEGVNAFPRFFDCPHTLELNVLPSTQSICPEIWRGRLSNSLASLRDESNKADLQHLSIDVARTDYEQDIVVFCTYSQETHRMTHLFEGDFSYLRSMSIADRIKKVVIEEMPLNQDICSAIKSFATQYFEDDNIGVHVRYTDSKVDLDKVYRRVDRIAHGRTRPQFFLATDSWDVESDFRRRYDNVLTMNKWFPPSGGKLHRNPQECSDLFQNGVEALMDLYLLSHCGSVIYSSRSSFGTLASWMSLSTRCHDIERTRIFLTKQLVWRLLAATRPTRRRFGLTKSAIKGIFASANRVDNKPS